jgi:hypothetical protein
VYMVLNSFYVVTSFEICKWCDTILRAVLSALSYIGALKCEMDTSKRGKQRPKRNITCSHEQRFSLFHLK